MLVIAQLDSNLNLNSNSKSNLNLNTDRSDGTVLTEFPEIHLTH